MHPKAVLALFSTAAFAAALPATGVASAGPATCSLFPWFIGPRVKADCSGTEPNYNPNSGPAPGRNTTCELLDISSTPARFAAVDLTVACGGYSLSFYQDNQCRDKGVTVTAARQCVPAPSGLGFIAFSAYETS